MKNFILKTFGLIGYPIYWVIAVALRVPVALFLFPILNIVVFIVAPIKGDCNLPSWLEGLYDWYRGK